MTSSMSTPVADNPTPVVPPRRSRWKGGVVLLLGGMMFGGLSLLLRHQQQDLLTATRKAQSQIDEEGKLRPVAAVLETTRALKLVTVIIESNVKTKVRDERWRGNASASVEAPVKYVYGVDLSGLTHESIRLGTVLGIYEITIPRPTRISTEVDGSRPVEEVVEVTGSRMRSVAGEYYLGLARKAIYDQARKSTLDPENLEKVERITREQVEDLVRRFVGPAAEVRVKFQDPPNR
jgi:Protein of unknown function (DUF4230)